MFKRILVPLDGSRLAEKVLPVARYLAAEFQATLVLFHVVEKDAPGEIHGEPHLADAGEAKTYLDGVSRELAATGLNVEQDVHEVQESGVAQTIRDHAEELHTDVVILCAHGNGGLRDMLFGSIAQQVIRQGCIPVLYIRPETVKSGEDVAFRHILLPLDGAREHEDSIPLGMALAEKCVAKMHLLTVVPTGDTLSMKGALVGRVSPRTSRLTLEVSAQQAETYLREKMRSLDTRGISVSGRVLRGDVSARVNEVIAAENIDLMVIATHGHNALEARWEGSLTPTFLPTATVPVLLLRGGENCE